MTEQYISIRKYIISASTLFSFFFGISNSYPLSAESYQGSMGRVYSSGTNEKRNDIIVYGNYIFEGENLSDQLLRYTIILKIYPSHLYVTFSPEAHVNTFSTDFSEISESMLSSGYWTVKGETIFFHEMGPLLTINKEYDYLEESGLNSMARFLSYIYSPVDYEDNVTIGIIENFGETIVITKEYYDYYLKLHSEKFKMFYIPEQLPDIDVSFNSYETFFKQRNKDIYFPWMHIRQEWQSGKFKVIYTKVGNKTNKTGNVITSVLEKDGLRFTVVNPHYYLPDSGLRLYDKEDEEALSAWMDTVQVGRSYEFELMRPAYPADSIAHFPPLQTVPDSIYAADGEAYGYFFARLKSKKRK